LPIRTDTTGIEQRYLLDMIDVAQGRTLEIGCGDGRMTWQYAEHANQVTAIDVEVPALQTARSSCPQPLEQSVSFMVGSAIRLPFAPNTFDRAVFAWSF